MKPSLRSIGVLAVGFMAYSYGALVAASAAPRLSGFELWWGSQAFVALLAAIIALMVLIIRAANAE